MHGVITALITPFHEDGSLDRDGLRLLVQRQVAAAVEGIVVLGTTGEASTLTEKERNSVIHLAVEEANGRIQVFVGTGCNATNKSIASTKKAKELGADGALVVTPYYNKPGQEGLYRHFTALAKEGGLPLILYNIPGRTSISLDLETIEKLAKEPNIIAIKEASGSIQMVGDVIHKVPNLPLFTGDDAMTLPVRSLGGVGVISVLSNLYPEHMSLICTTPIERAREIHYDLHPFFSASSIEVNPIPIKAMMRLSGLPAGPCRLPLFGPSKEHELTLQRLLEKRSIPHGSAKSQPS
jgi:4-hydroxy-tetrahydrodipicolinate synthase